MNTKLRLQLSGMMFLQYFIWGSWYVTMGPYLGGTLKFSAQQIGLAYSTTALAAMISPFFVGMIADRFFATEKVLAALHLLGGACLFGAAKATTFEAFFALLMAHTLCYMPTLALTNSLAFHQMKDPGKEFPSIRVLGTISWISAGLTVGLLGGRATSTASPFLIGAGVAMAMGLYCFTLPHTPPGKLGQKVTVSDILGLDALSLLKERSFAVFTLGAFLFCIPLTFYFSFVPSYLADLSISNIPGKMTMGQMSEIFFLLVMPFFFVRLGVKWMLAVGMLAWSARYLLFAFGGNPAGPEGAGLSGLVLMLYLGIILHGICYDFFFVTAYIYVDKKANEAIRAKAQGFIALVTLGAGMFVGSNLSGWVVDRLTFPQVEPASYKTLAAADWSPNTYAKWDVNGKAAFGKVVAVVTNDAPANLEANVAALAAKVAKPAAVLQVMERQGAGYQAGPEMVAQPLGALTKPISNWRKIWLIPAVGSLVILGLFLVLFTDKVEAAPKKD
jgi:nucleoside transporter